MARPAGLVQRVRIIQRHNALALAGEDARSRSHRRFIADDDARMRRQARSRAVGPDDKIRPTADLAFRHRKSRHRPRGCRFAAARARRRDGGHQNREQQRPVDGHVALRWLNRRYSRSRPNPHEFHLYYDI